MHEAFWPLPTRKLLYMSSVSLLLSLLSLYVVCAHTCEKYCCSGRGYKPAILEPFQARLLPFESEGMGILRADILHMCVKKKSTDFSTTPSTKN